MMILIATPHWLRSTNNSLCRHISLGLKGRRKWGFESNFPFPFRVMWRQPSQYRPLPQYLFVD